MVLSRGLGYYSELLISAIFTVAAVFVFDRRTAKREKEKAVRQKVCRQGAKRTMKPAALKNGVREDESGERDSTDICQTKKGK